MQSLNLINRHILVVEDEDLNWYLLRDMIEMYNGIAIHADTGMKAIDIVKNSKDIDLVLIDLNLPFMSGAEATLEIKQIRPDLTIIAQTAFAEPEMLSKAMKAGCSGYILKPIEFNELIKIFETHLD